MCSLTDTLKLWCWIDSKWSLVRIYSFYIPVWICIFLSIVIYVAVGYHVFHHRNQLRNMAYHSADKNQLDGTGASSEAGDSAEEVRIPNACVFETHMLTFS